MTRDLRIAKVYVSFLDNPVPEEEVIEILMQKRGGVRYLMGNQLHIRHVPSLRFYYDDSLVQAENIDRLIRKIHKDDG